MGCPKKKQEAKIIGVLGFLATCLCLLFAMCCSMREESMIEKLHRIVKEKNSLKVIEIFFVET